VRETQNKKRKRRRRRRRDKFGCVPDVFSRAASAQFQKQQTNLEKEDEKGGWVIWSKFKDKNIFSGAPCVPAASQIASAAH